VRGGPPRGGPPRGGPPPNSRHRVTITPSFRNKTKQALPTGQEKTRAQKHQSMTWAQRLKRVFNINIETCEQCGSVAQDPPLEPALPAHRDAWMCRALLMYAL